MIRPATRFDNADLLPDPDFDRVFDARQSSASLNEAVLAELAAGKGAQLREAAMRRDRLEASQRVDDLIASIVEQVGELRQINRDIFAAMDARAANAAASQVSAPLPR